MKRSTILLFAFIFLTMAISSIEVNYERLLTEKVEEQNVQAQKIVNDAKDSELILRNIKIWVPIGLAVILGVVIYMTIFMHAPKNTLLYATYVTNKTEKLN